MTADEIAIEVHQPQVRVMDEPPVVDVTTTLEPIREYTLAPVKLQRLEVEPETIKLKVGTLTADLSAACKGKVEIDGKPLKVRAITVHVEVGQLAKVTIDVIPV